MVAGGELSAPLDTNGRLARSGAVRQPRQFPPRCVHSPLGCHEALQPAEPAGERDLLLFAKMLTLKNYEGVLPEGFAQREKAVVAEVGRSKAADPGAPAAAQDLDFHAETLPSTGWLGCPSDNRRRVVLLSNTLRGRGHRLRLWKHLANDPGATARRLHADSSRLTTA